MFVLISETPFFLVLKSMIYVLKSDTFNQKK